MPDTSTSGPPTAHPGRPTPTPQPMRSIPDPTVQAADAWLQRFQAALVAIMAAVAGAVGAVAFYTSFEAIRSYAKTSGGITPEHAWAIPLLVDSFIVVATGADLWLGVHQAQRAWWEVAWPKALLGGAAAVSFVLNVAHAQAGDWPARGVAALSPAPPGAPPPPQPVSARPRWSSAATRRPPWSLQWATCRRWRRPKATATHGRTTARRRPTSQATTRPPRPATSRAPRRPRRPRATRPWAWRTVGRPTSGSATYTWAA